MSATATVDKGKFMQARLAGTCAECGGTIEPGQPIYFRSPANGGPRHKSCVEPGEPAARPADPAAGHDDPARRPIARDATRDADGGRLWSERDATRWAQGDATRAPRSEAGPPDDDDGRRAGIDADAARRAAERRATSPDGGPPTEFSRARDRDAARQELGALINLMIEGLERIRRLLS